MYAFEHSIKFVSGDSTLPSRSDYRWKSLRGVKKVANEHALGMEKYYVEGSIEYHKISIYGPQGLVEEYLVSFD